MNTRDVQYLNILRYTGCPITMTPMLFCQNFYNQWHFFNQILHTHVLNKDTHVDHFWCLISKYTKYDNIFINPSRKFWNKNFQPNAYQANFPRKLLGKWIQKHGSQQPDDQWWWQRSSSDQGPLRAVPCKHLNFRITAGFCTWTRISGRSR